MSKYALPVAFGVAGGFVGGATGFSVGMMLGNALFGPQPKVASQPPLEGLRVPNTAYGGYVADFYGVCRTAGTWIDASPDGGISIVRGEQRVKGGTGGRQKQTTKTYNYFLTAAYGLGEGLLQVDRIWADTKLIYNRDGATRDARGFELVNETSGGQVTAELSEGLRLYRGSRRQRPDSVLAALHGGSVPAYRGTAYFVLNNLDLSKFGNRVPTITALVRRVTAQGQTVDDAAQIVTLHALKAGLRADELEITQLAGKTIPGCFQNGRGGARNLIEQVARWHYCGIVDVGGVMRDYSRSNPTRHVLKWSELGAVEWSGAAGAGERRVKFGRTRKATRELPTHMILKRPDPGLNWELGSVEDIWQTAPGFDGSGVSAYKPQEIELQIVANDGEAAPRVGIWKDEMLQAREGGTVVLDIDRIQIAPGDVLDVPTDETESEWVSLLVTEQTLGTSGLLTCIGEGWDGEIYTRQRDLMTFVRERPGVEVYEAPTVALVDTATLREGDLDSPTWIVAASARTGARWSGARVELTWPGGGKDIAQIEARATMGSLLDDFALGQSATFDWTRVLRVQLDYGNLSSATESEVASGANLLAVGNRLVRFVEAVELAAEAGTYELSGLLDAQYGTDWTGAVPSGASVVLLADESGALAPGFDALHLGRARIGQVAQIKVTSGGDDAKTTELARGFVGNNLKPLAPARAQVSRSGGTVTIEWDARTRYPDDCADWGQTGIAPRFSDGGRGGLSFEVELLDGAGEVKLSRRVEGDGPHLTTSWSEGEIAAAGLGAAAVRGRVTQIGGIGRGFAREF